MKRLFCIVICLILALSMLTACNDTSGKNEGDNVIASQRGIVENNRYFVRQNKNTTEQNLVKSFYDDNYYYYFFNLGAVEDVPLQSNKEVQYYKYTGNNYTKAFKTTKTTTESVEDACSKAVANTLSFTNTASAKENLSIKVSQSVGASVDFVKATISAEMSASMEIGYARSTETSNQESRTESFKKVVSSSESSEETTGFEFTSESKIGYYRYIMTGVVRVYAVVIYSKADESFLVDTLTEVTAFGYSFDYSEHPEFDDNNYGTLTFDSSVLETLPTKYIPTERLTQEVSEEIPSQQEGDFDHFAGGYGTEEKPYFVETLEQFSNIRLFPKAVFSIVNDINGEGDSLQSIPNFEGTLKGGNHAIYNFTLTNEQTKEDINIGIFENNFGTIEDLTIGSNIKITDDNYSVKIAFACEEHKTKASKLSVGGIVGKNSGTIAGCKVVKVSISGTFADKDNDEALYMYIGGIVGYNDSTGTVSNCVVESSYLKAEATTIKNSGDDNWGLAGGVCGESRGTIKDCISRGNDIKMYVHGDGKLGNKAYPHGYLGGIVGSLYGELKGDCVAENNILENQVSTGTYTVPAENHGDIYGKKENQ